MRTTRTTVTLDADVMELVQRLMRERDMSFKVALNYAVRAGLSSHDEHEAPFRTPTFPMGLDPSFNLDKALRLAGELEDDELVRRLAIGT